MCFACVRACLFRIVSLIAWCVLSLCGQIDAWFPGGDCSLFLLYFVTKRPHVHILGSNTIAKVVADADATAMMTSVHTSTTTTTTTPREQQSTFRLHEQIPLSGRNNERTLVETRRESSSRPVLAFSKEGRTEDQGKRRNTLLSLSRQTNKQTNIQTNIQQAPYRIALTSSAPAAKPTPVTKALPSLPPIFLPVFFILSSSGDGAPLPSPLGCCWP